MPECHTCQYNGAEDAACLGCRGFGETNHRGKVHVRFEGNPEAQRRVAQAVQEEEGAEDGLEAARFLLACLTGMDDFDVLLLMDRCRGLNGVESAQKRRISKQAVHARMKKASARLPWLARFFGREEARNHG